MNNRLDSFWETVNAWPEHPAVVERHQTVSYDELGDLARRFAASIVQFGSAPRVLILLPSGSEAYAAMFGTLLAGGVYAPANLSTPISKQQLIVDRFLPDVIIATNGSIDTSLNLNHCSGRIDPSNLNDGRLLTARPAHDLAYVIFTSGSTGTPKGVMIPRSALEHYTSWSIKAMNITRADRWSQHPNIGFDLSVLDIYGALCGGATLFPLSENDARLAPAVFVRRNQLTIWNSVPSVVDIMSRGRQLTFENLSSLRLMSFCGEPLLPHHLDNIFSACPDLIVHNTYGPTEATVSCTLERLTANNYRSSCGSSVSLGDPIDGTQIRLVGGDHPDEGEIVIFGAQLAQGYWQDKATTAKVFRHHMGPDISDLGYFTGDWAERRNGKIFFKNRLDFQVKINGFRVELDEVNAALRHVGAEIACSAMINNELHAFVQITNISLTSAELRTSLESRLDWYAVPKRFHFVDEWPLSANGKTDIKLLIDRVFSGTLA